MAEPRVVYRRKRQVRSGVLIYVMKAVKDGCPENPLFERRKPNGVMKDVRD
ncbi:MAG: hypothetical protein ACRD8U_19310 [Pyrinomonadaceae bacterium]